MATQQSGTQQVLDVAVAIVAGGIVAAFLMPIGVGIWFDHFETSNLSAGGQALVSMGDVVIVLAFFVFLAMLAISAARS